MKSFLLLIFPLMAGCEVQSTVQRCIGRRAKFTCNKSKTKDNQQGKPLNKEFLWYSDEKNGHFTLLVEEHKRNDAGEYACKYDHGRLHAVKPELQSDKCCLKSSSQTAYPSSKTTITCDVQKYDNKRSTSKSVCNEESNIQGISSKGSKGRFRFTDTNSGLFMSISNVSSEDVGVYWCGLRSEDEARESAHIKFKLDVQRIRSFTRSLSVGQNFTYWCAYRSQTAKTAKFICRGEDPSECKHVVSTAQNNSNNRRFFFSDDKKKGNITITVTHVAVEDAGTYWCAAETSDQQRGNVLFHRFIMTVDGPSPEVQTTSPVPSPQSTTASAAHSHGVLVITTVIICVAVMLLLALISIYIFKRFSHSKTTRSGASQRVREDYVYEEIQELRQKPDTGNAMKSVYFAANFPTNPSASLHYSTINFHKADGETPKPSSSGCEYSTVKFSKSPKTVIQPSLSTDDALYSTVSKPAVPKKDHP